MQNQVGGTEKYPATLRRSKGGSWSTSPRALEIPLGYENMGYKWLYKRRRMTLKRRSTANGKIYRMTLFGVVWSIFRRCPKFPFMGKMVCLWQIEGTWQWLRFIRYIMTESFARTCIFKNSALSLSMSRKLWLGRQVSSKCNATDGGKTVLKLCLPQVFDKSIIKNDKAISRTVYIPIAVRQINRDRESNTVASYTKKAQLIPALTWKDEMLSMKGSMKSRQPLGRPWTLMLPAVPPIFASVHTVPTLKSRGLDWHGKI